MDEVTYYRWTIDCEALALLLRRRKTNASKVAIASGIDKRHLYRMLSGERANTTRSTVQAIASTLNVDVHLLADPRFEPGYKRKGG